MKYRTKRISAILFSTLTTIYLIFFLLSFFMLLVISMPIMETTKVDQKIGYILFPTLIFVCLISLISCFLILNIKDLKWYFKWPAYLCLPISIPLIILISKNDKKDFFDVQRNFEKKDSNLEYRLLVFIFIISCVFAFIITLISFLFLLFEIIKPETKIIILFLPIFLFGFSVILGGFFNLLYYKNPTKINKSLAWFGLIFTWWFLIYQDFIKQNINF